MGQFSGQTISELQIVHYNALSTFKSKMVYIITIYTSFSPLFGKKSSDKKIQTGVVPYTCSTSLYSYNGDHFGREENPVTVTVMQSQNNK